MSDGNFWDKAGFVEPTSNYFKFNDVGDEVIGVVVDLKAETFPGDESPTPKVVLSVEGEEENIEVTCGARNLKSLIMTERPSVGDILHIKFSGRQGQIKLYEMTVTRTASQGSGGTSATEDSSSPLD